MAMKKEDYMELGRRAFHEQPARHNYLRTATSWAGHAYWDGYEAEKARVEKSVVLSGPSTERISSAKPQHIGMDFGRHEVANQRLCDALEVHRSNPLLAAALEERNDRAFANWPKAAREHLRLLSNDIATCRSAKRQERLLRAVGRMTKRYGHALPAQVKSVEEMRALGFPISTQPHPDGPITAGMLLRGE